MRIAVIGWLKGKPHPPTGYAGIERTVPVVCTELTRQGHQVTLIAPVGSIGNGYEVIETSDMTKATHICNDLDVDVVHDNTCWDLESPVRQGLKHPYISVTHVNHAIGHSRNVVYLSKSQRLQHGLQLGRDLSHSPVVYVPINPQLQPRGLPRRDYLLYLGAIVEYKGVVEAARVAALLHRELVVAGIAAGDYANKVANMPNVKMVGEVSGQHRDQLIEQAYAMMNLFNNSGGWNEPGNGTFGEAMAFNTPVAAFRNGVMPELVRDGLNGWIADSVDDMATFMDHMKYPSDMGADRITYSAENIVKQYVQIYQDVINGKEFGNG